MKEKLHTIPVNEAFESDCECPLCVMKNSLEDNAIDFTMGPSYMEDDVRGDTSRMGFCEKHLQLLYKNQNRLGLALILKSHMDKVIQDMEKHTGQGIKLPSTTFFKKKGEVSAVGVYIDKLEHSCYICDMMDKTYERYIATIFHLYHNEKDFRQKFSSCKGFCTTHYKDLYEAAQNYLSGDERQEFHKSINKLYIDNMKRVRDDLEWFINKFDYRYAEEPWKNSKDAIPRALQKINSITKI